MRPSPTLCHRVRFTTKHVGKGFYRGTGSGAMGAHTEWGGYLVDWRKVRHYNVPDLTDFKLTPFVSREIEPPENEKSLKHVNGMKYLRQWRRLNPQEYDYVVDFQRSAVSGDSSEPESDGFFVNAPAKEDNSMSAVEVEGELIKEQTEQVDERIQVTAESFAKPQQREKSR